MTTALERLRLTDADLRILRRARLERGLEILRTHRHASGAEAVLQVLEDRKRQARVEADEWVSIDELLAKTGQRAIHSRISELRNEWKIPIEHNGRTGGSSQYRLAEPARTLAR